MLKIGICEDDLEQMNRIKDMTIKALFQDAEVEIYTYSSGDMLIHKIEQGEFDCSLLLLDIYMEGSDGMEVARYIRNKQMDVDIIFATASTEHVFEGYNYRAYAYLLKPFKEDQFTDTLRRYYHELSQNSDCINVNVRGTTCRLPLNKIKYFESSAHKVNIYMVDEIVTFYGKLNDVEEVLVENSFVRCHQSYIVNEAFIKAVRRTGIELVDEEIPVSRKYYEILKNRY